MVISKDLVIASFLLVSIKMKSAEESVTMPVQVSEVVDEAI